MAPLATAILATQRIEGMVLWAILIKKRKLEACPKHLSFCLFRNLQTQFFFIVTLHCFIYWLPFFFFFVIFLALSWTSEFSKTSLSWEGKWRSGVQTSNFRNDYGTWWGLIKCSLNEWINKYRRNCGPFYIKHLFGGVMFHGVNMIYQNLCMWLMY